MGLSGSRKLGANRKRWIMRGRRLTAGAFDGEDGETIVAAEAAPIQI
jgi:hypothetical protein